MTLIDRAKQVAMSAHAGMNYGEHPYTYHLEKVDRVLARFQKASTAMRCAAWLHDVVEDTEVTAEQIASEFPAEVARLVAAVTDCQGQTKSERKALTYRKLWAAGPDAIALKLADRIANVEAALRLSDPRLLTMYCAEHAGFKDGVYEIGENEEMWAYLDRILCRQ